MTANTETSIYINTVFHILYSPKNLLHVNTNVPSITVRYSPQNKHTTK